MCIGMNERAIMCIMNVSTSRGQVWVYRIRDVMCRDTYLVRVEMRVRVG